MSLLSIENVTKRYRRGPRETIALQGVSFEIESAELMIVLGSRRSGRSTLLRIAAGLERPDDGIVRFEGRPLQRIPGVVGRAIVYCHASFSPMEGEVCLDHVMAPLLARGLSSANATRAAQHALERTEADRYAAMRPAELNACESIRVALARALVGSPRLLVSDDPTAGTGTMEQDSILLLLRSIAEEKIAVLMCSDDATCASGTDRALYLDAGRLRAHEERTEAEVVSLSRRNVGKRS